MAAMTKLSGRQFPVLIRPSYLLPLIHDHIPNFTDFCSMRILLAEDDKKIAGFIRKALRESGYAVDEANDGDKALDDQLRNEAHTFFGEVERRGAANEAFICRVLQRQPP